MLISTRVFILLIPLFFIDKRAAGDGVLMSDFEANRDAIIYIADSIQEKDFSRVKYWYIDGELRCKLNGEKRWNDCVLGGYDAVKLPKNGHLRFGRGLWRGVDHVYVLAREFEDEKFFHFTYFIYPLDVISDELRRCEDGNVKFDRGECIQEISDSKWYIKKLWYKKAKVEVQNKKSEIKGVKN